LNSDNPIDNAETLNPSAWPGKRLADRPVVTVHDVARFLDASPSAARRLLTELRARGLRRKGRGRGTRYDRAEFLSAYRAYDAEADQ